MKIRESIEEEDFDPTEPSLFEYLGDYEGAIRSMTCDQGVERIACLILEEYRRQIEDPSWEEVRRNPPTAIAGYLQDEPTVQIRCMSDAFRKVWQDETEILHRNLAWYVYNVDTEVWAELARHPIVREDLTLDLDMRWRTDLALIQTPEDICFLQSDTSPYYIIYSPRHFVEIIKPYSQERVSILLRMSERLGLPVIPWIPGQGIHIDTAFGVWLRRARIMAESPRGTYPHEGTEPLVKYFSEFSDQVSSWQLMTWTISLDQWEQQGLAPPGYSWRQRVLESDPKYPGWVPPCVPKVRP